MDRFSLLTDPLMTVRLPSALDNVSAELLLGAKPPKMVSLRIVHDDFRAFLAVVLFELSKGLDDGNDLQAP